MKRLILMRGVSGSGKSTVAEKLQKELGGVIYSTDDFFIQDDGRYLFDGSKLQENHQKNKDRTEKAMIEGISPIIIDNTNRAAWEMKDYAILAQKYGYSIEIRQPGDSDFPEVDFDEIMRRQEQRKDQNKSLPPHVIQNMIKNFQRNVTLDDILNSSKPVWKPKP
jgi:predicted kinase